MKIYAHEWKFIEYLRGRFEIEKPVALPWGEWEVWEKDLKKQKPLGFFLTETVPDFINDVARYIPTPISDIRYYVRNRFIRKTHILPTRLNVGEYHDLDTRILHGLMESLVDFVEIELAYKSRWCGTEESKTAEWIKGRCPELGLEYLAWEMTLDDPNLDEYNRCDSQAQRARDIKTLYDWWKIDRPSRPEPYEASGWSELCEWERINGKKLFENGTEEEEARKTKILEHLRQLEQQYEDEDEAMLLKLIRIRRSLWT